MGMWMEGTWGHGWTYTGFEQQGDSRGGDSGRGGGAGGHGDRAVGLTQIWVHRIIRGQPGPWEWGPSWNDVGRVLQGREKVGSPPSLPTVQQEDLDFHLSPNIITSAGADDIPYPRAPSPTSTWGSILEGFPPAWPLPDALSRYCRSPSLVPRAPRPSLPPAAFAHLRRQVAALDSFWPRLDRCCQHHTPLPCARRAVSPGSCHHGGHAELGCLLGGGKGRGDVCRGDAGVPEGGTDVS